MFCRCSGLQKLDLSSFDTNNTTTILNMFDECSSLIELKLPRSFKINKVT